MRTIEKKLQELEMRVSFIEKRLRISQPEQYAHLTGSEIIKRLNNIIKKANSETDLSSLSATEILLKDRSKGSEAAL